MSSQQLYIFKLETRTSYLRGYVGTKLFSKYSCIDSVIHIKKYLKNFNNALPMNQNIYMKIKKDKGLPLFFGSLIYYGFNIINLKEYKYYVSVELTKQKHIEVFEDKKYTWFISLPRTGKGGKRIFVYKLRTMQPYSEYIQDFIIEKNGLNSDGTIKDDFRITKFGKFARKYWLDELPMLFNFIKGDLKFIGVRPLSDSMLSQYPKEHVQIRNQSKPGLIPPYYIDKPKTFDEIILSEKKYLDRYKMNPILTDISYFGKFLKVIFFQGVRSS